ncbi:hypothetical protein Tco_1385077 [Tanacetum coccineum]
MKDCRRKVDIENLEGNIVEFTTWDEMARYKISIRRPRNRENKKPRDSAHTLAAANFKGIRFTCEATITGLREVREWHYTSCNQCNKNESEQEELMQKYRAAGHRHIPKEIVDIIGKKHAFHIHFGFGTGIGSG